MHSPAVTVIVPSYGRPRQVLACVEALAAQELREPWEMVIVDDGSPEPLAALTERFAGRLDLRVVRQENAGPAAARNRGAAEARGEYIAFTDDDCRPEPAWLETLLVTARNRPGALVGGTTWNGLPHELFASTSQLIIDLVYEHFNANPEQAYFLTSNNMLARRDRYLSLTGFDTAFTRAGAEDREFCDRWRCAGWPIVWKPEARVEHRHSQTLRRFVDLHFRYGRGAYFYHAIRRQRFSGTMHADVGFHMHLRRLLAPHLAARKRFGERARLLGALALWQAANAAGFAAEGVATSLGRRHRSPLREPA